MSLDAENEQFDEWFKLDETPDDGYGLSPRWLLAIPALWIVGGALSILEVI